MANLKKIWLHDSDTHTIAECYSYLNKSNEEKTNAIRDKNVCWNCLIVGHIQKNCFKKKPCGKDNLHHESLHEAHIAGISFHTDYRGELDRCILLVMYIPVFSSPVIINVMWDTASTISLITFKKAKELKLTGDKILSIHAHKYNLNLVDRQLW